MAMNSIYRALVFIALFSGMTLAESATPQELADINAPVEQVFDAPGYSKDQLFNASRIWIAQNFRSGKAVVEYESKEEGTIVGNGTIAYPCKGGFDCMSKPDWRVRFTMRVDIKDGKFRLTFSNMNLTWPASYNSGIAIAAHDGPLYSKKDREKVTAALLAFGPKLQLSLGQAKTNDDW